MSKELPPSVIAVERGMVTGFTEWTSWNGVPSKTTFIIFDGEEFTASVGDPEHGESVGSGKDLREILAGFGKLHKNVIQKLVKLFSMKTPTEKTIQELYPRFEVAIS